MDCGKHRDGKVHKGLLTVALSGALQIGTRNPLDRSRHSHRDVCMMHKHSKKKKKGWMVRETPAFLQSEHFIQVSKQFCFMLPFLQHRGLYDVQTSEKKIRTPPVAHTCQIVAAEKQFWLM